MKRLALKTKWLDFESLLYNTEEIFIVYRDLELELGSWDPGRRAKQETGQNLLHTTVKLRHKLPGGGEKWGQETK